MQAGSAWKGDAAPKFKLLEQTALNLSKLCTPWRLSADCRGADFRGAGEVLRRDLRTDCLWRKSSAGVSR